MEIVGIDNLEAKVVVPSSWLVWIKKGMEFDLFIDETKTTIKDKEKNGMDNKNREVVKISFSIFI